MKLIIEKVDGGYLVERVRSSLEYAVVKRDIFVRTDFDGLIELTAKIFCESDAPKLAEDFAKDAEARFEVLKVLDTAAAIVGGE